MVEEYVPGTLQCVAGERPGKHRGKGMFDRFGRVRSRGFGRAILGAAGTAGAQDVLPPSQEVDKRLCAAEQVAPLTADVFGEQVGLYDRSASFEHVDISLPGNSALPVAVRRKLDVRPLPQLLNARRQLFGGGG